MDTTSLVRSLSLFALAGLCEIGGGYLVWVWLRDHRTAWLGALGGLVLFLYGVLPTLQPGDVSFGRVYAAYGGVFVAMSLLWGWWIDGLRPDRWDLAGAAIVLVGVGIIMYAPAADISTADVPRWSWSVRCVMPTPPRSPSVFVAPAATARLVSLCSSCTYNTSSSHVYITTAVL